VNGTWGIFIGKPTVAQVDRFLQRQAPLGFSYAAVGATRGKLPPGYVIDHNRVRLGQGAGTFLRAQQALGQWKMFELGWVDLCWPTAPLAAGTTVGVLVYTLGVWLLNPCRIVYVVDETVDDITRFGFAYGTLPGHWETGEERFLIEWNHTDDTVCYDLLAFSRPRHSLAWLGYPMARQLQKQFARHSKRVMEQLDDSILAVAA
jgi:uncharacterized protein (UPF0548 family)